MANSTRDVLSQTVNQVAMIINGAPFISKEDERDSIEHHRNNTPWHIHFPSLGITFQVLNEAEEPIVGYYHDRQAESDSHALWEHLRSLTDKERVVLRDKSEFPILRDGFKMMTRILKVQAIG